MGMSDEAKMAVLKDYERCTGFEHEFGEDGWPVPKITDRYRDHVLTSVMRELGIAGMIGALVVAVFVTLGVGPANANTTGTVSRIVDGDTIVVSKPGDRATTVRILAIDTPETKHPKRGVECWGPEATKFARDTLLGQTVTLVEDSSQDGTDRYGRVLAEVVRADGWNYSVEAARAGAAESYVYSVRRPARVTVAVQVAEREAQAAGRGMWGPPCYGER